MMWRDSHEDEADEADDPEAPDESDQDDADEPDLIACPDCGRSISEDAERCHHCGSYVLAERATSGRWPLWIIIAAVLAGIGVVMWII